MESIVKNCVLLLITGLIGAVQLWAGEATYTLDQVFMLSWGEEVSGITYRESPGGRFGPRSFFVSDGGVYLLDTNHDRIVKVAGNKITQVEQVPPYSDDILRSDDNFYVLNDNRVFKAGSDAGRAVRSAWNPTELFTGFVKTGTENYVISTEGKAYPIGDAPSRIGYPLGDEKAIRVKLSSPSQMEIQVLARGKQISSTIHKFQKEALGSARIVGVDARGWYYITVDFIVKDVPLETRRKLYVFTADHREVARFSLPSGQYTYLFRELQVMQDGTVYHLVSTEQGLSLYRWSPPDKIPDEMRLPLEITYPDERLYRPENGDFNDVITPEPETPVGMVDAERTMPTVTRSYALQTGDTYVTHTWTCNTENMSDGRVQDPDGIYVRTPGWLSVGQLTKVPYQWGGFRTLAQFDNGIATGWYAGDIDTDLESGYAYGVDCSGFVSRCWNLPYQYSTRMMDDDITVAYDSWSQLLPGDAIHRVGHVRMMVQWNDNGSLTVVEASGQDWRVSYRNYTVGQLGSYTPRYYVEMEGSPTPLPVPHLASVTIEDSLRIDWESTQSDGVAGYHLYRSADMEEWGLTYPVSMLPSPVQEAAVPIQVDVPVFFRLVSVDEGDTTRESVESDTYGAMQSSGSQSPVLVVDGFDRYGGSGSWPFPNHEFAGVVGKSLSSLGIPFVTCANELVVSGDVVLEDYSAVIWVLGDESTVDETLNQSEMGLVAAYLESGGQLFISGSEVGWHLDYRGTTAQQTFYNAYFKADYEVDDTGIYTVTGSDGGIFQGLTFQYDDGSHGVYEEDYPDGLAAVQGGEVALTYENSQYAAGVQYQGSFAESQNNAKLVYMAFPFETIYDQNSRHAILSRIVGFFGYTPQVGLPHSDNGLPRRFTVADNYPNPFNGATTFEIDTPESGEIRAEIFNLRGQMVRSQNLVTGQAGRYRLPVDLSSEPSGTYLARIWWNSRNGTVVSSMQKLVLIK